MTALPALARMACVWMDYAPLHVTVLGQTSMEPCAKIVSNVHLVLLYMKISGTVEC